MSVKHMIMHENAFNNSAEGAERDGEGSPVGPLFV